MERPEFLKEGEPARLFPTSSRSESQITSIFLAVLTKLPKLAERLFDSIPDKNAKIKNVRE